MASWLDDTVQALENLGGVAKYREIYAEVARLRVGRTILSLKATVRKEIERHSKDSRLWEGKKDLFYSLKGLGTGTWGLKSMESSPPNANDLHADEIPEGKSSPAIALQTTFRIIRETELVRRLKTIHKHRCQLCEHVVALADGVLYSEGHHIRPLGKPHAGPDTPSNIIIVCPTCHVLLDYFAIPLAKKNGSSGIRVGNFY